MLYNRNQFKKVNDKKVLHKIRKRWVVVSVALLGLLGAKSVATHANANADVNADANNQQANHQLGNQSIKSTSSIVPDKSASLASGHVQASLNNAHSISASSTTVDASSASSQYQNSVASSSVTSTSASDNNVSSEAQQIHDHVLSEFANNNRIQQNKGNHLLGGSNQPVPKNNNSIMGQLMNIMHNNIQSGTNEAGAKNAYADILNIISPDNLTSASSNKISAADWYNFLTRFQNDLNTINNNGNHNPVIDSTLKDLKGVENYPINVSGGLFDDETYTLAKDSFMALGMIKAPLSLSDLAQRFDTPGGGAHGLLTNGVTKSKLGMTIHVSGLHIPEPVVDKIGTVMRILNNAVNNSTLKQDYSNVVNDLNKLPNQSKAQQANTLSDLSNHISAFASDLSTQGNGYLPSQDKQYFSGITSSFNNAHRAIGNEATKLNNEVKSDEITSINKELNQYNVGSLFNDAVNYVANHNDYTKLNSVANDAKADFANATNASAFINSFVSQIADLKNADASTVRTDLDGMKDNSAVSDAYGITKANSSAANNVLDNLASLNSANVTSNLDNVHNAISNNGSLAEINALNNVANSASTEATSVSESNAYKGLLNHESTLFSSVVNRINARGFNSSAFNKLVNNAKNDLANASNVSDFASDLNGQAGAFNGVTAQEIKNGLTNFVNNPEFSNAYQAVRTSSAAADGILNDLSGMNSNNEVDKLSEIANVAKNNFSNSASFGSLASNAANMQTSVSNDQSTAASKAYSSLLTNHESGLFSAVVNRINANGFNSNAFDTLVSNVKNDLAQASNASEFANRLASQDGNFNGVTAQEIKNDLTNFVNNPEFSNAYKAVHTSSNAADGILDDLSGMNSDNEVAKLSDIANVAKNNFSNSASFGSLATDATNMQTSVANVKNETPTQVTNVITQAHQKADDLSDNVNTAKNNMGSLASNYDGQQASTEMNLAVGYANDAKEYAQKAANDAIAETGVHFTGLGAGTPDYIEDIRQINNDVSKGNAALSSAKTDANLSRVDSELNNLNVKGLFNDVLNYVVSHNDYGKFNQAVTAANNAFNSKDNVTDFVNDFSNQIAGLTNGNATTVKQVLKDHGSDLTSAYQVAKDNHDAVNSALNDLNNLTPTNATNQLNAFHDDLTNNGTFKQLGSLEQVAQVASDQASQINQINQINDLVNGIINPGFVKGAVQRLVNEPESKRSDFKQLVSDAKNALTNYDNASGFINSIENDQDFKKFTGNKAAAIKDVLSGLNKSSVSSIVNDYYNQVKAQKNDIDSILDNLSKIADNPYESNASQNKSLLNDIYGTISGNSNLKLIPGFNNVATGIDDAESSTTFVPNKSHKSATVKASVQKIADMVPLIVSAITKPGFDNHDFDSAIDDVNRHLSTGSLAGLWNAIKDDSSIEAFTNHYGVATSQVTNLLNNSNSSDFKALDQAYQQAHNDSNVKNILSDLQKIANNHKNADGKSASHQTNVNVQNALKSIANAINGDKNLKNIQGMQGNNSIAQKTSTEASQYNPAIETPAKHQTTIADVQPVADMMPTIVNAITKPGFKASQFDGAIQAVESHLNDSSLSQLWNDVKGNPNVTAFTNRRGNLTKQITDLLNGNGSEVKELSQAYQQTHNDNNVKNILNDLQKIANNHLDNNGKSASHQTNVNVQNALKSIANAINGDKNLKNIQGMQNVAQNASSEASYNPAVEQPKPSTVTPSVQVLDNMLQPILNRIVAKGFDGSAFQNAISAVKADIHNASTLFDLWNDVQSNSGVQYFVGNHGGITQSIISKLSDTNSPLEAAYKVEHQDSAMTKILNDLSDISKHQQVSNNEVAKQSDVDDVNRDLSDINNQINRSNTLRNINGMTTLMNHVHYSAMIKKNPSTPTVTVKPDVSSIEPLISGILSRMTAANFDSRDFDNVIKVIKDNIKSAPSLSKLWLDIDNNQSGVKRFTGSLDHDITAILNNDNGQTIKALNAAYQQTHTDNNVTSILTDLQKIADNHLNANDVKAQNGRRDAIRQALTDISNQLNKSPLKSVTGANQIASDVQNGINAKQYQDQDQPHYANSSFNQLLNNIISNKIKTLSDKLASADFAKSSDRSVFNQIINDLKGLPNSSDPNSKLSDISSQLSNIKNSKIEQLAPIFQDLISQIEANDSTPEALAAYADSLNSPIGSLINDFNAGMQDVKNGQNNTDYKNVLNDLMKIDADVIIKHDPTDARRTQEDSNLKAIANIIKNGGLKNIPLLKNIASVARHAAAADSHARKHASIHTTDKNNHINHVNHVNHIKKQRADAQHWNDVARHNRIEAAKAATSAVSEARDAKQSADAAQSFTNGLNSGSDSIDAQSAAKAASTDADHASSETVQAMSAYHKAMKDSVTNNDVNIITDANVARNAADQAAKAANSTANEFNAAKNDANKAGLAPRYADQTFNDALGHLINDYTMQKLVDHLTSSNFAKSGERKAFNDVLTQFQKLPSQLSSQKKVNDTLNKISSDLNSFHGPISKGMAKKVQSMINDVKQHDATPSTLVTYANSDGADGKLINDLNAGMQTVKNDPNNTTNNKDYQSILNDLIDLDTNPAHQDHDLGEIAKTIKHNSKLKTVPLLKNVSRVAYQMARNANRAQQNRDGQRHAKMINDENQHREDVVRHALISANHAASNATSIASRAVKSADAVQSNASGLNPGSDSTLASSYAINASADANQMKDVASQASSLAHVARANDRGSASVVLNDTKAVDDLSSLVSDNASIVTIDAQGASKAAQRAGKAPRPDVTVVASVVPQILQRITAKGFDSLDFDKAVDAAKSDLSAKTLTSFLNEFDNNGSVGHFLRGNGAVTQAIIKLLGRNGNLQSAYYDYHKDVNLPQILSDLEAIAAHQQVDNNLVANDQDRTAVKNDLNNIVKLANDGRLNKIAGANDVLTAINSFNSNYKPSTKSAVKPSNVKPSLPITTNFVDHVLNRLTDPHFNKSAFASAITYGIEPALNSESTLGGFIKSIQSNSSVGSFINSDGPVTQEIMSLLTDTTSRRLLGASKPQNQSNKSSLPQQIKADLNAAYGVAHGDYNHVDGILNLLVDISKQPLDRQGKSDPIYNDLNAIAKDIDNDSSLKSVGGMPTVAYQAKHDAPRYQVVPHYADQNFNQALSDLVNNYTVQQLADHLASKRFAQSGEKKAFNRIITDLEYLPNSSNANLELSDIDSELNNFRGPLSKQVAAKVQSLIPQVEKHDSNPDALTVYANSLNNSDGNLINDLNKGFQDVKSGQNNLDYQAVLNDVMDIDQNPKQEDHDLNDIAGTINKDALKNIPVLKGLASTIDNVANNNEKAARAAQSSAAAAQKSAATSANASKSASVSASNSTKASQSASASASNSISRANSSKAAQSASVKSADSRAISEASVAKDDALSAELNAASDSNSVKSITPSVNNDVKGLMSMHNQYQGDSSLSDDAKEASNYADEFSTDAKSANSYENQTNSADMLANSDYKATSLAASANNSSLAASYANDGSQEATQASQYALSTANEMSAASQASSGIASLAHDAALQSSADVKMNSINASASSAINSAKSNKSSSAKSGSKSSKASSNNDSSAIASANSRASSAISSANNLNSEISSIKSNESASNNSYSSAIKSALAANDSKLANSLTSASKSTSQSYSAALSAANSAESAANSKASASASAASKSASIAASIASSAESASASSAESASSSAEKSSEAAHDAAVMSGIRASLTSASQSASIAESIDAASASRSASARESAQAQSNSIKASSAESAIQSMTALIKSYADALNSAGADHGSTNPNVPNNQNDSSAIASAEASAANAENVASTSASLSASISASEAIASQEAMNNNQSRGSSEAPSNVTRDSTAGQYSQPSNVAAQNSNDSDPTSDTSDPTASNRSSDPSQDPSESDDESATDPSKKSKRVGLEAADPVSHRPGNSDPVESDEDPTSANVGSSEGLGINEDPSNGNVGTDDSGSGQLPQTGEADSEAKVVAAALLSLSAALLSVGLGLDLKHRN